MCRRRDVDVSLRIRRIIFGDRPREFLRGLRRGLLFSGWVVPVVVEFAIGVVVREFY